MKEVQLTVIILSALIPSGLLVGQTISLDGFLDLVRKDHPIMPQENLSPKIERKQQESFLGAKDWLLRVEPSYMHTEPIQTNPFSPSRIDEVTVDAMVERLFWSTGGRLSVELLSNLTDQSLANIFVPSPQDSISIPTGFNRLYENRLSVNYTQPLMQGAGGKLARQDYEASEHRIDASRLLATENQEQFLLELGQRFLDWQLLHEKVQISTERWSLAQDELNLIAERRQANLVDQVDVLRAEDAVRIAEQTVRLLQSQEEGTQSELAVLAQNEAITEMEPDYDIYGLVSLPSRESAFDRLEDRSRSLLALEQNQEELQRVSEGFAESVKPKLDLTVGLGLLGGDRRFNEAIGLSEPNVTVSLLFEQPVTSTTARANFDRIQLQIQQLQYQSQRVRLNLQSSVTNLLVQIKGMEQVLALNREQIESARQKTEEELQLYNQGRSQLTFVIQSRDNEQSASLTYAENAVNYHKLVLRFRALTDQLMPVAQH